MGIENFLDASTGHITYEDNLKLLNDHLAFPTRVIPHEFGWWINVPDLAEWNEHILIQDLDEQGYSQGFLNLLKYAAMNGCWWINLDCDAYEVEGIDVFEW